jgi:glycosyltransferase involved in cell wall biosynthesis
LKKTPLFSVIIPTYNRASKCIRAVESVLRQTCQDFDLWVIDDGSSDDTKVALEPYLGRVNYRYQANQGTCVARNTGIQCSNGRYVAFLDSDDVWLPDKLAAMQEAIQAHPEVGVFYSSVTDVTDTGRVLWQVSARQVRGSAYLELLKADFIVLSSVVIKRDCLVETGLFDLSIKMSEDWDMLIRLARRYPIFPLPRTLVIFEYGAPDKKTRSYQRWIAEQDVVIQKAFQADPSLTPGQKRQILSSTAYVKGRICLESRAEAEALPWFRHSLRLNIFHWKSAVYLLLLSLPPIRRILPASIKASLRLPEAAL